MNNPPFFFLSQVSVFFPFFLFSFFLQLLPISLLLRPLGLDLKGVLELGVHLAVGVDEFDLALVRTAREDAARRLLLGAGEADGVLLRRVRAKHLESR